MKRIINRGTSSQVCTAINPSNWCGDSFSEFQRQKKSKNRFSQIISLSRGTSSVLARNMPETRRKSSPLKSKYTLSYARGTSTRVLEQ